MRNDSDDEREEGNVIEAGDTSPDLYGESYDGQRVALGKPVRRTVLFFYPKADTPG
jgi:peroxiredoxin